jgi:hypothetical protein
MLRRVAALIFLIGIAGQAWAAACVCDDSRPVHSCCLRKAEKNDYFSTKPCCDEGNCVSQRTSTPPAGLGQAVTFTSESVATPPASVLISTPKLFVDEPVRATSAPGRYKYRPRPPDLDVRHHAFRI